MTAQHKFKVGDKVVFTNEFGVCFGVRTIISLEDGLYDNDGPRYGIEPTDCPWFPKSENHLKLADFFDKLADHYGHYSYLQSKHGRPTTKEELASLLDEDPFEFLDEQ